MNRPQINRPTRNMEVRVCIEQLLLRKSFRNRSLKIQGISRKFWAVKTQMKTLRANGIEIRQLWAILRRKAKRSEQISLGAILKMPKRITTSLLQALLSKIAMK